MILAITLEEYLYSNSWLDWPSYENMLAHWSKWQSGIASSLGLYQGRGLGMKLLLNYIAFTSNSTISSSFNKLVHPLATTNRIKHFYFNRLPRLWNALPSINLTHSHNTIMGNIRSLFWNHFVDNFDENNLCSFHFCCPCTKCSGVTKQNFWC